MYGVVQLHGLQYYLDKTVVWLYNTRILRGDRVSWLHATSVVGVERSQLRATRVTAAVKIAAIVVAANAPTVRAAVTSKNPVRCALAAVTWTTKMSDEHRCPSCDDVIGRDLDADIQWCHVELPDTTRGCVGLTSETVLFEVDGHWYTGYYHRNGWFYVHEWGTKDTRPTISMAKGASHPIETGNMQDYPRATRWFYVRTFYAE